MRRLITTVVVLVAVFVVVDRVSVLYAQNRIAAEVQKTEHLTTKPTAKIHGFPFLTQLIGRLSDVEIVVNDYARSHAIPADRIDVHLRDAEVAFNNPHQVKVKHVDAVVRFGYDALSRAHDGLHFSYAGADRVRVTGTVTVAGRTVSASGTGRMNLDGNDLAFTIDGVDAAGDAVSGVDAAVRRIFGVTTGLPTLPFHFHPSSVRATADGIEVSGQADNVILTRGGG